MSDVKTSMQGIEEMTRNLEKLGTRVALRGPNAAVRAAGSVIIKEMRRRAPKDTGSLKKALGQRVKTYRRSKAVASIIGARSKRYETSKGRKNPAYTAHLVEFGTKPHGGHPGTAAKPFMRPAWDASAPAAKQAVIDKMTEIFQKEAAAVGSK